MRGLAVLIMIEAHLLDSWTRTADRGTAIFGWAITLGGIGAPLFLLLAGVSVALSAGLKLRQSGKRRAAARQVARRGLEIFGLAFLFRLQAWILSWGPATTLLRVDILNIMGPSIAAAAGIWGLGRRAQARLLLLLAATLALVLATPLVRTWPALARLPDPIEAYVRPAGGYSLFVVFPWSAFVFAGAVVGVLIEAARTVESERRLTASLSTAGLLLAALAFACSYLPSPFAASSFWTTSPAYFFLRVGLMLFVLGLSWRWVARTPRRLPWSPLVQLGRTSLFIYWIHVEMVYGLVSLPLHRALSLGQAAMAYVVFVVAMLACSVGKEQFLAWYRLRQSGPVPAGVSVPPPGRIR